MPFCPNCRTEYDEGYTVCADCGAHLVDLLPKAPDSEPALAYGDEANRVFLVSACSRESSAILIDMLNDSAIPAFAQPKEGSAGLEEGSDIFVDRMDYESAMEIAASILGDGCIAAENSGAEGGEASPDPARHVRIWVAAAVVAALIACAVLFSN